MEKIIDIKQGNLPQISTRIAVPVYDRSAVSAGIVHIGVGGFHRAHQAFLTHVLLNGGETGDWGICGICLLEKDKGMYEVLCKQDGLYTLIVKDPAVSAPPVVSGAIVEYFYGPEDPDRVVRKMADEGVKIISLTITESGYNFDPRDGRFMSEAPLIQQDLTHPDSPQTIFGYLTAALKKRKDKDLPVTILSCDNIQHNGEVARKMLSAYVKIAEPDLLPWMESHVSFPNSMVDRITPVTQEEDKKWLQDHYGIRDAWPVVTENFYQWIIEDDFKAGKPPWDRVGARFVEDVSPYEKMKIGLLNGGHSLLALTGRLAGYQFIHEIIEDPLFEEFYRQYMDNEVTPSLDAIEGVDLNDYKDRLVQRFSNPFIKDGVDRITLGSSAKIPGFILPVLTANLLSGRSVRKGVMAVACWYLYLADKFKRDCFHEVDDAQRDLLEERVKESLLSGPKVFLCTKSLFGDLVESERFVSAYLDILRRIEDKGIREAIKYESGWIEETGW